MTETHYEIELKGNSGWHRPYATLVFSTIDKAKAQIDSFYTKRYATRAVRIVKVTSSREVVK